MMILEKPEPLRNSIIDVRATGDIVGYVPTMGALHEGHRAVLRRAREACDCLVTSLFVNPTQFDSDRDAEVYPRRKEQDHQIFREENVDFCFEPDYATLYPEGDVTGVVVDLPLTDRYEGEFRPRFFEGVARVVSKFFNIIPAHEAFFGEKDLQQYLMLKRMVRDLHFPQSLRPVPVARDENGVAYSSRNRKFTDQDWELAAEVYKVLQEVKEESNELSREDLTQNFKPRLESRGMEIQYFDAVSLPDYESAPLSDSTAVLVLAGYVGDVRLKDNLPVNYDSVRAMEADGQLGVA